MNEAQKFIKLEIISARLLVVGLEIKYEILQGTLIHDTKQHYPEKNHCRKGNGILRMRASTDKKGNLLRYSLAYINPNIYNHDNGRVLGYDNDHDYHHRHHMGKIEKVDFNTFEEIQMQFEAEWRILHDDHQKKKIIKT